MNHSCKKLLWPFIGINLLVWSFCLTGIVPSYYQKEADKYTIVEVEEGAGSVLVLEDMKESENRPALRLLQDKTREDLHSSYLMQYQPGHFTIRDGFTLPMPQLTLPIHKLITQPWMEQLRSFLREIPPHTNFPISIASADFKYKDMLLNWLISATVEIQPPLTRVLVLSLDQQLHDLLIKHGLNSLHIDPSTLLYPKVLSHLRTGNHMAFRLVMLLRLTVMRLMNHWGYDTANYDIDAIMLNNPEHLYYGKFETSDLIGSQGRFPEQVRNVFGLTMCAGVFMLKSTMETEQFWNTVSQSFPKDYNDQLKLNTALTRMSLQWHDNATPKTDFWQARNAGGFTVTILNEKYVCRRICARKRKSLYYVWHNGGKSNEGKIKRAKKGRIWYLRNDWVERTQNSTAKGIDWLREMKKLKK